MVFTCVCFSIINDVDRASVLAWSQFKAKIDSFDICFSHFSLASPVSYHRLTIIHSVIITKYVVHHGESIQFSDIPNDG